MIFVEESAGESVNWGRDGEWGEWQKWDGRWRTKVATKPELPSKETGVEGIEPIGRARTKRTNSITKRVKRRGQKRSGDDEHERCEESTG